MSARTTEEACTFYLPEGGKRELLRILSELNYELGKEQGKGKITLKDLLVLGAEIVASKITGSKVFDTTSLNCKLVEVLKTKK